MSRVDFRNIALFDARLLPRAKEEVSSATEAWEKTALKAGMDACYLRMHDVPSDVITLIVKSLSPTLPIIMPYSLYTGASGVRGVHFKEHETITEVAPALLRGKSCHSLESVLEAQAKGLDYVFFSPIFETKTHPEAVGVGLEALKKVCAATKIPVFALGGINKENRGQCIAAGAYGVAAISMFCAEKS